MVEIQFTGRLGNEMFEYAVGRTVAERNGYKWYVNPESWLGKWLFQCDLGEKDGETTNWFHDKINQPYNPEIYNIPDFTGIAGFFQSHKYFDREQVKEWFTVRYSLDALSLMEQYPREDYCYLNVRGDDQKIPMFILPQRYYDKAIAMMKDINPNMKFVVVTDDIEFSKEYFPDYPIIHVDTETDFGLLHNAKYVVSAISTFC